MKTSELRTKSNEELKDLVLGLKKEQFNLRMQASTGELTNKSRFKEVRRTIARAHTLIKESALMGGKAKAPSAETKTSKAKKAPAKKKTKE